MTAMDGPAPRSADPGNDPRSWTPWTGVGDREEILRRLEILAASDEPETSQVDFVLFYFRASDPVLYPPAAVALGRRLGGSADLSAWVREYARGRGIPVGGQVPLTRTRSARRVLLCAAAATAREPGVWVDLGEGPGGRGTAAEPDPLAPLPSDVPLDHPQDLVAYLRALRILLEGVDAHPRHRELAGGLLEDLSDRSGILRDRAVALRWAELLVTAQRRGLVGDEGARILGERALNGLVASFHEHEHRGVPERLGLLRAMDSLIRMAPDLVSTAGLPSELQGLGAPQGYDESGRARFMRALARLGDPRRWWALDEGERAWTAFVLLAGASGVGPAAGEVHRILDAFRLPPSPRPQARVLRTLAEREGIGPGEFVDSLLLHALEDETVLLELVPEGPPGEPGAILADAVEHRIRLGVLSEPGFRAEEFLARMETRRPHPQFIQLLRTVVGDRSFRRPDGEVVPLDDWLQALQEEAQTLRDGGAVSETPPTPGALASVRRGIRRGLLRLGEVDDPGEMTRGLASLLEGGRTGEEPEHSRDLRSLLHALWPRDAPELEALLHRHASSLRAEGAQSVPPDLLQASEARSAAASVRTRLRELEGDLTPLLPAAEGSLLRGALARVDRTEGEWVAALSRVEEVWRGAIREGGEGEELWGRVLESVARVPLASHRRRLYPVVWQTLVGSVRDEGGGYGRMGGVHGVERLISWAIQAGDALDDEDDREAWLGAVADHWAREVEEGMEQGLETRVGRFLRDPGPRALALLPGVDGTLERTRVWLFDCYRLGDAARASRILNHRRGRGAVAALPWDLLSFFLHYSPLWLALLVGAVLMLDFGDAWTAMAEVGDVRGIAITFLLGVLGAFGYVTAELHARVTDAPGDRVWENRGRRLLRVTVFVAVALAYTVGLVSLLWWLLSGTDEVVHGEGAVLHVMVWSGFTLFIGVFFGLLAKDSA